MVFLADTWQMEFEHVRTEEQFILIIDRAKKKHRHSLSVSEFVTSQGCLIPYNLSSLFPKHVSVEDWILVTL
jgi:hypothetical protein